MYFISEEKYAYCILTYFIFGSNIRNNDENNRGQ